MVVDYVCAAYHVYLAVNTLICYFAKKFQIVAIVL